MRYYQIYAWTECPFCVHAKEILAQKGEQFVFCCIDQSDLLLEFLKQKYDWQTVPMIVEKKTDSNEEKFIGGFTDLVAHLDEDQSEKDS